MSPEISVADSVDLTGHPSLSAMVAQVARNFEAEYMHPDDPQQHGRRFPVADADADLILHLGRDGHGNETIYVVDVEYWHTNGVG